MMSIRMVRRRMARKITNWLMMFPQRARTPRVAMWHLPGQRVWRVPHLHGMPAHDSRSRQTRQRFLAFPEPSHSR